MEEDIYDRSVELHTRLKGKITVRGKQEITGLHDLSLVYSPGVARPSELISKDHAKAYDLTWKGNSIAVVSDGSAVLGLGNIGPEAALPVMEGKAMLFSQLAGIDAIPLCVATQNTDEIVAIVRALAPTFGGINLEDIAAPRCFEIEKALQDIGIPVFHDDQHGTAIVVLAGLINALKVVGKHMADCTVVINGAGAAGSAIAHFLLQGTGEFSAPRNLIICDSHGIISSTRTDLTEDKQNLVAITNKENMEGSVRDALMGADIFVGVSRGGLLHAEDIAIMNKDAIVFALANPTPEITPDEARAGGAVIVATGRSDFPNQVNNVLAFPGIFRGALDSRAQRITPAMQYAASKAIADLVSHPTADRILPGPLDPTVVPAVAKAVAKHSK
ncbi:MAG: NADP-dependent malic enzyme [Patescibacteria group bacterium]